MPYRVGSKSSPTASPTVPSLACLSDRLIRRRSRSISMILTKISSPTWTTCSGISTCRPPASELCTTLPVHGQHLAGDLLAHLDALARVVDVLPGQLGYVHQAVLAAHVYEQAEVD